MKITSSLENLTNSQKDLILYLKNFIKNDLNYTGREIITFNLLRFCKARDFKKEKVKKMITEYINFKKSLDFTKEKDYKKIHLEIKDLLHNGFCNYSKEGFPIYIEKISKSNYKKIIKEKKMDKITEFYYHRWERFINIILPIASKKFNKRIEKCIVIYDCKNLDTFSLLTGDMKKFIKKQTKIGQDFYPEVLQEMYFINVPTLFNFIWKFFKVFLDKNTLKKIFIFSGNGKKELEKKIDLKLLPVFLGGEEKCFLGDNPGPWKKFLEKSYKEKKFFLEDDDIYLKYFLDENEIKFENEKKKNYLNENKKDKNLKKEFICEKDFFTEESVSIECVKTIKIDVRFFGN